MYPYDVVFGLDMYEIMIGVGFFCALLYLRFWGDRRGFSAPLQNLCIVGAAFGVIGGAGSAIFMQAIYNFLADGSFVLSQSTGSTFYGGLIGGAAVYLLIYFAGGRIFLPKGEANARFFEMSEIAAGSIALAHAFGRVGCLFAGCCHGQVTDAWYGIYNVHLGQKTVPTQLFETIFLLLLATYLSYRLYRGKHYNLAIYLMGYAVWRFILEYIRDDDRGATVLAFLTPSQLTALLLFLLGGALIALEIFLKDRARKRQGGAP